MDGWARSGSRLRRCVFARAIRVGKIRAREKAQRRKARRECAEAIERFDAFEAAMDTVRGALRDQLGTESDSLLDAVEAVLHRRHRASSAIEGFNAALRPYLYVHKGVTQGFLDLFRAWFNLRTRRWGRHKRTSAHECLTGQRVGDWLARLGYPPSPALA